MACDLIVSLPSSLAAAPDGSNRKMRAASATELCVALGGDDWQAGTRDQMFATKKTDQQHVNL